MAKRSRSHPSIRQALRNADFGAARAAAAIAAHRQRRRIQSRRTSATKPIAAGGARRYGACRMGPAGHVSLDIAVLLSSALAMCF
jgi:hypothetical protein